MNGWATFQPGAGNIANLVTKGCIKDVEYVRPASIRFRLLVLQWGTACWRRSL